jgi:hypothetical protein
MIHLRDTLTGAVHRGILHMSALGWTYDDIGRRLGYGGTRPGGMVAQIAAGTGRLFGAERLAAFNALLLRHGCFALSDAFDCALTVNIPRPPEVRDGNPSPETLAAVEAIGSGHAGRCGASYRRAASFLIAAALDCDVTADRPPVQHANARRAASGPQTGRVGV